MFEGMEGNPLNEGGTPITGSDEWADGSQSFLRYEVVSIFDFIKPVAYNFSVSCVRPLLKVLTHSSSLERSKGKELNGNQNISTAQLFSMISCSLSFE